MSFRSETIGTPAVCVTAVQAMTSGTLTTNEVAMLARQIPVIVTEINAYPAQSAALHVIVEGGNNFDGAWIRWRIEPAQSLGSGYYTTPVGQIQSP